MMRVGGFFIFMIGLTMGVGLGWIMHNYPDEVTTEGTYCRLSGARLTVTTTGTYMGATQTTDISPGPLAKMMFEFNGEHPYEWVLPRTYLPPTRPEPLLRQSQNYRNELIRHKLHDLNFLNQWPEGLAILYSAMGNSSFRTVSLIQEILNEHSYLDVNVLLILDRPGSWRERWAALDTFLAAYHCDIESNSVRCVLDWNGKQQVLFLMAGAAVETSSIDWERWPSLPTSQPEPPTPLKPVPPPADFPVETPERIDAAEPLDGKTVGDKDDVPGDPAPKNPGAAKTPAGIQN